MNVLLKPAAKLYTYYKYRPKKEIINLFSNLRNTADQYTTKEDIKHKKILFCPFNPHQINIYRESILGYACKIRGAEVKMISFNLHLDALDFISPKNKKDLKISYKITQKIFNFIGIPVIYISKYCKKTAKFPETNNLSAEAIQNYHYKDIYVGDLVTASTVRYYLSNGVDWENHAFLIKAQQFLKTAMILVDTYEAILQEEKPDKVVTSHGIYVSWGTLFKVARKMNIPIDVYSGAFRKNTLRAYHNLANAPFPEGAWPEIKDIPLTKEETKIVNDYFQTRSTQKEDNISLFNENDAIPDYLKDFINKSKKNGNKLFCLFTNIAWDSFMYRAEANSFNTMTDWIAYTIDLFRNKPDATLIVKAHPAENFHKVPEKYRVKSYIPKDLPDNIIFLDENARVKPFDLYPLIDLGLTYISTVALEMAILNIPVLTAGVGGQYSNKGFTIDPDNIDDYRKKIDEIISNKLKYKPNVETAKRYLHFRLFKESHPLNVINLDGYNIESFKFKSCEDLKPGNDKTLDILCNGFLNDDNFVKY